MRHQALTATDYVTLYEHAGLSAAVVERRVVALNGEPSGDFALCDFGSNVAMVGPSDFASVVMAGIRWADEAPVGVIRCLSTERANLGPLAEVWALLEHGFRAAFGREPVLRAQLTELPDGGGYYLGVVLDGIGVAPAAGEAGFMPRWRLWTTASGRAKDGATVDEVIHLPALEPGPAAAARRVLTLCAERLIDNVLAETCYTLEQSWWPSCPTVGKPRC
jgi:hypothetical protein